MFTSFQKHADLYHFIESFEKDAIFSFQISKFAANTAQLLNDGQNFLSKMTDPEVSGIFTSFLQSYQDFVAKMNLKPENLTEESLKEIAPIYQEFQSTFRQLAENEDSPYLQFNDDFDTVAFSEFLREVFADVNEKILMMQGEDGMSDMKAQEVAEEFNDEARQEDAAIDWSAKKVQNARESQKKSYEELKFLRKVDPNNPRVLAAEEAKKRAKQKELELQRTNPAEFERRRKERAAKGKINSKKFYEKVLSGYSRSRDQIQTMIGILKRRPKEEQDPETLSKLQNMLAIMDSNAPKHLEKNKEQARKLKEKKDSGDSLEGLLIKLNQSIASQKTSLKDILSGGKTAEQIKKRIKDQKEHLFRPFIDAIDLAKQKGDLAEEMAATKVLQKKLNEFANEQPEVAAFDFLADDFYEFRNAAKEILKQHNWLSKEGENVPSDVKEQVLAGMREEAKKVIMLGLNLQEKFKHDDLLEQLNMSKDHPDHDTNFKAIKLFRLLVERVMSVVDFLRGI